MLRMSTVKSPSEVSTTEKSSSGSSSSSPKKLKPVNLSFRALESRGKEREKPTKSPLIVHHSLYGRKENWNPISEVSKAEVKSPTVLSLSDIISLADHQSHDSQENHQR